MVLDVNSDAPGRCSGDPGPPSSPSTPSSADMAAIASRYLSMALSDGQLSADEQAVHDALQTLPPDLLDTPTGATLEELLRTAQQSGGGLSPEERQLIQSVLDLLQLQADPQRAVVDRQATAWRQGSWFTWANLFELARLDATSVEWAQIEHSLGHEVSYQGRQTAINAARSLVEAFTTLYANANEILCDMRKGARDTTSFRAESQRGLADVRALSQLGTEHALPSGHTNDVVAPIEFVRAFTDLFGGAEKIACPSSNPHHGWFILTDALQLAGKKKVRHGRKPTTTSALFEAMKEANPSSLFAGK